MSGINILLLIVLINIHLIQAQVITHGVNIPKIDITRVLGKWFFVAGPSPGRHMGCITIIAEQSSDNTLRLTANITATPEGIKIGQTYTEELHIFPISCTMWQDMIFDCHTINGFNFAMLAFDVDYDSYIAVNLGRSKTILARRLIGDIMLLGRQPTLPIEIIDKQKNSIFYRGSRHSHLIEFSPNADCH